MQGAVPGNAVAQDARQRRRRAQQVKGGAILTRPAPLPAPSGPAAPLVRIWRRLHTVATPVSPQRLEVALQAKRSFAMALALLLFVLGFTIDDARVLRIPGYLAGTAAAIVAVAAGPMLLARMFVADASRQGDAAFAQRAAHSRRSGALALLLAFVGLVAWLVLFSAGVPPWAA